MSKPIIVNSTWLNSVLRKGMALRAGSVRLHTESTSQDVDWWKPLGAKWRVTAWLAKSDQ